MSPSVLGTLGACDGQGKEISTLLFLQKTSTQGLDESCTLIVLSALSVINRIPNAVKSTDRGPDVGTGPVYVSGQISITQIPTDPVKVTSLYILLPN